MIKEEEELIKKIEDEYKITLIAREGYLYVKEGGEEKEIFFILVSKPSENRDRCIRYFIDEIETIWFYDSLEALYKQENNGYMDIPKYSRYFGFNIGFKYLFIYQEGNYLCIVIGSPEW
jgi:hypothetical protein